METADYITLGVGVLGLVGVFIAAYLAFRSTLIKDKTERRRKTRSQFERWESDGKEIPTYQTMCRITYEVSEWWIEAKLDYPGKKRNKIDGLVREFEKCEMVDIGPVVCTVDSPEYYTKEIIDSDELAHKIWYENFTKIKSKI